MGLAVSTFYYKNRRDPIFRIKSDLQLRDRIESLQVEFPGYGYRRVMEHFRLQGERVNHKRIKRIMREFSLYSVLKKKFKPRSECPNQYKAYPNLVRGITLTGINQLWSADITYIRIETEFVYLAAVIDVYSRKIVGWSVGKVIDHKLCLRALDEAIKSRKPPTGCIHHSDRGLQYMSDSYVDYLEERGFRVSMSAQAKPTDNAYIESFFKTLKHEEVLIKDYETFDDVKKNIPKFIEDVYNKKRLHSSIGYQAPEVFERNLIKMKASARPIQKLAGTLQN